MGWRVVCWRAQLTWKSASRLSADEQSRYMVFGGPGIAIRSMWQQRNRVGTLPHECGRYAAADGNKPRERENLCERLSILSR